MHLPGKSVKHSSDSNASQHTVVSPEAKVNVSKRSCQSQAYKMLNQSCQGSVRFNLRLDDFLINNDPPGYFAPILRGSSWSCNILTVAWIHSLSVYCKEAKTLEVAQIDFHIWPPVEVMSGALTWNHAHGRSQNSMSACDRGGDEEWDDEDSSRPRVVTAVHLAYSHGHRHEQLERNRQNIAVDPPWFTTHRLFQSCCLIKPLRCNDSDSSVSFDNRIIYTYVQTTVMRIIHGSYRTYPNDNLQERFYDWANLSHLHYTRVEISWEQR